MESVLEVDPLTEFFSAIRNPNTRQNYEKDLGKFFDYLKIDQEGGSTTLKDQARAFTKKAKSDLQWATYQITADVQAQKLRVEKGEIADSRVANLYKPIRLFCEENDIILNWKKLARRMPRGRGAANDRAPALQEIKTTHRWQRLAKIPAKMWDDYRLWVWDLPIPYSAGSPAYI
ncbi:MAG: hypothetical protein ACREBS_02255 [Nitrososphaerales archaeon]